MSKLIITRGLPGSGKTTWAKDFIGWEPGFRARVNRDDLRQMLHGGFDGKLEQQITKVQHQLVRDLLLAGKTVVVDDTNLRLRVAKEFARIAHETNSQFEVNDEFLGVTVDECIRRDSFRLSPAKVGERVIREMAERYNLKKGLETVVYQPPAGLAVDRYYPDPWQPKVILADLDGTMALMGDREPYDWHRVGEDEPNWPVVNLVSLIRDAASLQGDESAWEIIFMSGRDEVCRPETQGWLKRFGFEGHKLFMRPTMPDGTPQPKDSVVKLALFNEHIRDQYNVQFVLDDRDQVVEMWRSLGLTCLQVAPGSF